MPLVFALFSALLIKHYIADFVLQPTWMLKGKGSLTSPGGYAHAGFHAVGSAVLLLIAGVAPAVTAAIAVVEFVVHFVIDFAKDRITSNSEVDRKPHLYWKLHGLDQLLHQFTYVVMTYAAFVSMTAA